MKRPTGFEELCDPNECLLLLRPLYGLIQGSRQWYKRLKDFLTNHKWNVSQFDTSLFIKGNTIIAVYVDDLRILANTDQELDEIKIVLTNEFKMSSTPTDK
jgi:hypothetical protein